MKARLAVGAAVASGLVLAPAAAAQAAEHHPNRAEKRHARVQERRTERRATKPPQDTTTTPPTVGASGSPAAVGTSASRALGKAPKIRGVVSCGVTAVRAGAGFTVVNGCDRNEIVTVSIQAQPGPWHRGLCQAGGCHLISRYDVVIPARSTKTITPDITGGCWVQVDVKWDGRLIRSNHYANACTKPKPPKPTGGPPVQTTHKHGSHADGHHHTATPTTERLAYTASEFDLPLYAAGGGLLILAGTGLLTAPWRRFTKKATR